MDHAERVPEAVAARLGVREQPGRRLLEVLAGALRSQALLLVLDNCEHLVGACAELADHLLRRCPGLRILSTSREPLNVAGETTWRVPSLTVPSLAGDLDLEPLAEVDAVRLFTERAAAVLPQFSLTEFNAAAVARLCRRLDGIPLALELAAARVSVMSVEQIDERLDDALGLLTGGTRLSEPRQRTLRATLDWSYGLLTDQERTVFQRLSVFADGWTLAAAESVCADDIIRAEQVLDVLARLVDKSLVICHPADEETVRYSLLETLRQYSHEKLEECGQQRRFADKHADYFLGLAERTEPALHGRSGAMARARLHQDEDNFRAALRHFFDTEDAGGAQRLAGGLARFWFFQGSIAEGDANLSRASEMADGQRPTLGRAKCLHGMAMMGVAHGDPIALQRAGDEARVVWRTIGNRGEEGFAVFTLGSAALYRGDHATAEALFQESLAISRAVRFGALEAVSLSHLAELAYDRADFAHAQDWAQLALRRASEVGLILPRAVARRVLGLLRLHAGSLQSARALLEASLADWVGQWWTARTLVSLAEVAIECDELANAGSRLSEGLQSMDVTADRMGTARALETCGYLAMAQHAPESALRLVGAAMALRRSISAPLPEAERAGLDKRLVQWRVRVGTRKFENALAEGESMAPEDAIVLARGVAASALAGNEMDVLSAREREVAALVARGMTNPQIARELVIGDRTAQSHVASILAKLGLSSRVQIAAWVIEHPSARDPRRSAS